MNPQPGKWYVPPPALNGVVAPRRVLAIGNGHVIFSDGSRKTKKCTIDQFESWCHKNSAEPA